VASVARVTARMARETGTGRVVNPSGIASRGSSVTARPARTSARLTLASFEAAVLAAGALDHLVPRHARLTARPDVVRQSIERLVAAHQQHRVVEQVVADERARDAPGLVLPLVAEDQVEVAERERRDRLLGLGLDQLRAKARGLGPQPLHHRQRELERHRLERGDPRAAGDGPGRRGQVGLGVRGAFEQRLRVLDQDERRVGQPHAASGLLEQGHAGLALEHRELL
jgi:hypothetical protein